MKYEIEELAENYKTRLLLKKIAYKNSNVENNLTAQLKGEIEMLKLIVQDLSEALK